MNLAMSGGTSNYSQSVKLNINHSNNNSRLPSLNGSQALCNCQLRNPSGLDVSHHRRGCYLCRNENDDIAIDDVSHKSAENLKKRNTIDPLAMKSINGNQDSQ